MSILAAIPYSRAIVALVVFVSALTLALSPASATHQDYTPREDRPVLWFAPGPTGAYVQNQGSVLNINDAVGAWNAWVNNQNFLKYGSDACGTSNRCIIFGNELANLYWTYCQLPDLPANVYARVSLLTGDNDYNTLRASPNCRELGSMAKPIWTVTVNTGNPPPQAVRQWLQRHEAGHALGLWHPDQGANFNGCWSESWYVFPLMYGFDRCPPPNQDWLGLHYNSSPNEVIAALRFNCLWPYQC